MNPSSLGRAVVEPDVQLGEYAHAVVTETTDYPLLEVELTKLLRNTGFIVIGNREAASTSPGTTLIVKCSLAIDGYSCITTLRFEDFHSGRLILLAGGRGERRLGIAMAQPDCDEAWRQVEVALTKCLREHGVRPLPTRESESKTDTSRVGE